MLIMQSSFKSALLRQPTPPLNRVRPKITNKFQIKTFTNIKAQTNQTWRPQRLEVKREYLSMMPTRAHFERMCQHLKKKKFSNFCITFCEKNCHLILLIFSSTPLVLTMVTPHTLQGHHSWQRSTFIGQLNPSPHLIVHLVFYNSILHHI